MSQETIGDVIKAMRDVKWPSPAERYWAKRLEVTIRTAPERIEHAVDEYSGNYPNAIVAELGLGEGNG